MNTRGSPSPSLLRASLHLRAVWMHSIHPLGSRFKALFTPSGVQALSFLNRLTSGSSFFTIFPPPNSFPDFSPSVMLTSKSDQDSGPCCQPHSLDGWCTPVAYMIVCTTLGPTRMRRGLVDA